MTYVPTPDYMSLSAVHHNTGFAAEVTLKDGRRIIGEITNEDSRSITIASIVALCLPA